jgi:hypothetical protein
MRASPTSPQPLAITPRRCYTPPMPHAFVQVGNHHINLDLVTSVELVPDLHDPAKVVSARIHYTTGKSQDFTVPADIQSLAGWLRSHKAP